MKVVELKRIFVFKDKGKDVMLDDPNNNMSVERVVDFYSDQYPQFINTEIISKGIVDDQLVFEINAKAGTKG